MARVLELAQLLQHDHVAEVDVGRGRVDAELGAQRPALLCAPARASPRGRRRAASRPRFARGSCGGFGSASAAGRARARMLDSRTPAGGAMSPRPRRDAPREAPRPQLSDMPDDQRRRRGRPDGHASRSSRPTRTPTVTSPRFPTTPAAVTPAAEQGPARAHAFPALDPGGRLDRLRDDDGGRPGPAGARVAERVQGGEELESCSTRSGRQLAVLTGENNRILVASGDISPNVKQRRDRDRGPALLQAQGRRLPGHRARAVGGRARAARRPGRLHDHPAVRQERAARAAEPLDLPEAEGGGARLPARAQVDQGQDPHRVPEHRLLRRRAPTASSRRRACTSAGTTPAASPLRGGARAGRGRAARGHDRLARRATARSRTRRRRSSAATSCSSGCGTSTCSRRASTQTRVARGAAAAQPDRSRRARSASRPYFSSWVEDQLVEALRDR